MFEDFNKWNKRKIEIHASKKYKHPKEREIWWCSVGMNIGTEIYGKDKDYSRPVLIVNVENGNNFIGVPLTSKLKNRKYSCIIKSINSKLSTALVYQIRNFDKRRLVSKMSKANNEDYTRVINCILSLCKI